MSGALAARIAATSTRKVDPAASAFARYLASKSNALGVLFYGSNLRTGSREGVLDFYILLPGPAETGLWPRVSYREWEFEGETLRAKIATMSLAMFARAASGKTIDTTIWARFVQPSALVWHLDEDTGAAIRAALAAACETAARLAVAVGPPAANESEFWKSLFRATYKAELRVEKPGREDSILALNPGHFEGLLEPALEQQGMACAREGPRGDVLVPDLSPARRADILRWWGKRRRRGKALNIARLLRATRTFDGAARYAAWKVERHTGIPVEITPFREKHPVLAAPAVLFKLWRNRRTG